jgi:hypothetical protein
MCALESQILQLYLYQISEMWNVASSENTTSIFIHIRVRNLKQDCLASVVFH